MRFSWHARVRQQQRGISLSAVEAVLDYGIQRHLGSGRTEFFLGRRGVEAASREGVDVRRFERTAVIATSRLTIVTVYKTARPTASWSA